MNNNDENDLDIDESYDSFLDEKVGLELRKKPSQKQKNLILNEAKKLADEETDFLKITEEFARDCFEPLYFEKPKLFFAASNWMQGFLSDNHPMSCQIDLNEDVSPLHIKKLLKKPTFEQLVAVVEALKNHDPSWNISNGPEAAMQLANVLAGNFPELIKETSKANNRSTGTHQNRTEVRSGKKGKNKKIFFIRYIIIAIIIFVSYKSCIA